MKPAAALEDVHRRIAEACERSGRAPGSVSLVAISKTFPAERVREMIECGQDLFGENRVQEALAKIPEVGAGARWHLVGHLQRNKARHSVGVFELIHSVDGLDLARELDKRAAAEGVTQSILVQANLSSEETKYGVDADRIDPLIDGILELGHLELQGLMTIPPWPEDPEESRPWFVALRELRNRLTARTGRALPDLSMGMTGDFEVAVEEGATLVRVGRALFGRRP